jgi:hypothetical protein
MLFGTEPPKGDRFQLSVRRDLFRGGHVPTRLQWTSAAKKQAAREQQEARTRKSHQQKCSRDFRPTRVLRAIHTRSEPFVSCAGSRCCSRTVHCRDRAARRRSR